MAVRLANFDAVLFDLDGTLVDSYRAIAASVNHVRQSRRLPPLTLPTITAFVGRGAEYLLTQAVGSGDLAGDLRCYRAHHPSVMRELTTLLPDAQEVLRDLREIGKRLAVCSNKPRVFSQNLLEHLEVAGHFAAVLGPEDVPRPKPAPDMLRAALRALDVPPERALYIGDMAVDVQAARAAGIMVWGVPTGAESKRSLERANPDRLLAGLRDIFEQAR